MFSPFHCFMPFLMKKKPMYSPLHCVSCPFDSLPALFLLGEKEYYKKQFATLRSFEEVDSLDSPHVADEEQDRIEQNLHERAMKISNWANIFLLLFKVIYFSFWNYGNVKWFISLPPFKRLPLFMFVCGFGELHLKEQTFAVRCNLNQNKFSFRCEPCGSVLYIFNMDD